MTALRTTVRDGSHSHHHVARSANGNRLCQTNPGDMMNRRSRQTSSVHTRTKFPLLVKGRIRVTLATSGPHARSRRKTTLLRREEAQELQALIGDSSYLLHSQRPAVEGRVMLGIRRTYKEEHERIDLSIVD